MLSAPKKTKFKKFKKRYFRSQIIETKMNKLIFGSIGLKAQESSKITARQIESVRQCINRNLQRKGKIWLRIFPFIGVTAKPTENRMGKGKGNISHWVSFIKAGSILFEVTGVPKNIAVKALLKASNKFSLKSKIISC